MDAFLSLSLYMGVAALGTALVALLRPIRLLSISTRRRAILLLVCGAGAVILPIATAPRLATATPPRTRLDEFVPAFHFREHHATIVNASAADVFAAIKAVTASDIALFQTFTWLRRFGARGPESILHAPEHLPILDVATRTTFVMLAEDPGRELVIGSIVVAPDGFRRRRLLTPGQYAQLRTPGFVTGTLNFLIEEHTSTAVRLSTETRVYATDDAALRRFTPYWRVVFPGSAILRVTWLRAVKERAERAKSIDATSFGFHGPPRLCASACP